MSPLLIDASSDPPPLPSIFPVETVSAVALCLRLLSGGPTLERHSQTPLCGSRLFFSSRTGTLLSLYRLRDNSQNSEERKKERNTAQRVPKRATKRAGPIFLSFSLSSFCSRPFACFTLFLRIVCPSRICTSYDICRRPVSDVCGRGRTAYSVRYDLSLVGYRPRLCARFRWSLQRVGSAVSQM